MISGKAFEKRPTRKVQIYSLTRKALSMLILDIRGMKRNP